MSLPRAFHTLADSIPASMPYVQAPPEKIAAWQERLGTADPRLKIGIAWAGNRTHDDDARRSIALQDFAPLFATQNARFFSLQKGPGTEQTHEFPLLCDWTRELGDFSDTAALVSTLDLVIAVDTAIVHLAGALGKPVWTLVQFDPDWRWGLNHNTSAWYPSMRLIRQRAAGDWREVIQHVALHLHSMTSY